MEVDGTWLLVTKVYAVVMTLATLVVTLGLVYLGRKLARLLDTVTKGAQPVIWHMQQAGRAVNDTAQSVSERAQRAAEVAEVKVAQAASELEAASESIRKAAAGPAGSIGALLTGLGQGLLGSAHKEGRERE
jgi:predicted PurR-regulated permease PerM